MTFQEAKERLAADKVYKYCGELLPKKMVNINKNQYFYITMKDGMKDSNLNPVTEEDIKNLPKTGWFIYNENIKVKNGVEIAEGMTISEQYAAGKKDERLKTLLIKDEETNELIFIARTTLPEEKIKEICFSDDPKLRNMDYFEKLDKYIAENEGNHIFEIIETDGTIYI